MRIDILTLFPKMYNGFLSESIIGKAISDELIQVNLIDFREYSTNKHKKVDDYPYGGGQGMVLCVEPVYMALKDIDGCDEALKILLTPQGEKHSQTKAIELSTIEHIIMICGHYEGFDERIRELVDIEISIGDYVITGGELASMVLIDSIARNIRGVLGNAESVDDSFSDGILEGPQYTRPEEFIGMRVPDVLLSGHHKNIMEYREREAIKRTLERRPDLLNNLDKRQLKILAGLMKDN